MASANPKITERSAYVFPSPGAEGFMSNNTMLIAMYRMGFHGRATVHGFRAVASTLLNEMGFHPDRIERQLAMTNATRFAPPTITPTTFESVGA
jgi:hypothetical protein